ncbi:MAG: CPBP family intramembrane glutamic endopeptidase [Bacteroidota bacterium]
MQKAISTLWQSFILFLKEPTDGRIYLSSFQKFKNVLGLWVIQFLLFIPIAIFISALEEWGGLDLPEHKIEDLFSELSPLQVFFMAVVLAPIVEEFFFRTFITLRRFYPLLLFIDAATGPKRFKRIRNSLKLWNGLFPFLIYASALLFGYVHIFNFEGEVSWWKVPLAVLPQIIMGLLLAFIRVRYGLVWSMFSHAFWNLIPTLAFLVRPDLMNAG